MFDVYLLESIINGILLGGVLALLALGCNLIFGVIDVVWICYAELIMMGMYGMFYLVSVFHLPFIVAAVLSIALVSVLGVLLHVIVIAREGALAKRLRMAAHQAIVIPTVPDEAVSA